MFNVARDTVAKVCVYSCLFLKLIDVVTTHIVVSVVGYKGEANPIMRYCMEGIGLTWTMILSYVVSAVAILLLYRSFKKTNKLGTLCVITVLLIGVAVNNIWHIVN